MALLSHLVWRMQREAVPPLLSSDDLERLLRENRAPTPVEQVQNLVLWLGKTLAAPGEQVELSDDVHRAVVGATSNDNFFWLLREAINQGVLDGSLDSDGALATLSFDGWALYQQLSRQSVQNRTTFMAMPFGDAVLERVFSECFRPAVAVAGFDLVRLDEAPPAGLIDDRLRVEIRRARFVLADLTGGNHGAYWEAGFAEGLGKPVIYTCEATYFDDAGTHFDTSHLHTVLWREQDLIEAAHRLTASIRATLPSEATLGD